MTKPHTDASTSPLAARADLSKPRPLRICFPILLDGDLVMSPEHLGVGYLVSVLRAAGAECLIQEVPLSVDDQTAAAEIAAWKPDIVGISLTTVGIAHAVSFGAALRAAIGSGVFVLAGGPLATNKGRRLLETPGWEFIDGLIWGEGEIPMLRFAEAYHTNEPLTGVPNLTYRSDGEIRQNPMVLAMVDLDQLPPPARDQVEKHGGKIAYLRLSTSRGCTACCTFCNAPNAFNRPQGGKVWRGASPQRVVDEIERLHRTYSAHTFDFVDSTFEDPGGTATAKARVAAIASEILRRDLKIYYNVCMQARNWSDADRPLIDLMVRSGLEKVLIGVESGSDAGLSRWKKKSTADDNVRAIRLMREAGVYVAFGFITFHPWSTFDEIRTNHRFLRDQIGHNLRRYTVRFELYPGAEAVEDLRRDGLLGDDFHTHGNPLAYRFRDPLVERLARGCALLYGDRYQQDGVIDTEPAVFEFETYDIVLHTFFSRLKRHFGEIPAAAGILAEGEARCESVRHSMSERNYGLMSELVDLAEADRLTDDVVRTRRTEMEAFYRERLQDLRSLQMKVSLNLHRAGIPVRSIRLG